VKILPNTPDRLLFAGVVLLAVLSFVAATRHMTHSIYFDESQTVDIARQSTLAEVFRAAIRERPYPPLFFFVEHYALHIRDDEVGPRVPAALFGGLGVIAVFLLGRELTDSSTGAIAALFFVLAPGAFHQFVNGNAYTLLMMLAALATWFLWRAVRSDGIADWLGYVFFALLGLATHTLFAMYILAQAAAGLWLNVKQGRARFGRLVAVFSLLGLATLCWAMFYSRYGGQVRPLHALGLPISVLPLSMAGMYLGALSVGPRVQLVLWCLLQVAGAALLFRGMRRTFWFVVIFAGVSVVMITLFLGVTLHYIAYRYALGVFPLACIVSAFAARFRGNILLRVAIVAAALGYSIAGATWIATANDHSFEWQDWRSVARYLEQHATPQDAIVLRPDDFTPLTYYYKGPVQLTQVAANGTDDAVAQILQPGSVCQKVWVVAGFFANTNPMVARITEAGVRKPDVFVEQFTEKMKQRHLRVEQPVRFYKVIILIVTRE
jgi:4-amino-4-deoxy-L-arabinose transferase-like glycosyltransferase